MGRTTGRLCVILLAVVFGTGACGSATTEDGTPTATTAAWEQISEAHFTGLEPANLRGDPARLQSYPLLTARDQLLEVYDDPARFSGEGYLFQVAVADAVAAGDFSVIALPTAFYGAPREETAAALVTLWADPDSLSPYGENDEVAVAGIIVTGDELGIDAPFVIYGAMVVPLGEYEAISSTVGAVPAPRNPVNAVTDSIAVGRGLADVAVYTAADSLYVADAADGTVAVVDTNTHRVRSRITVGTEPRGLVLDTGTGLLYVANSGSQSVSVVDTLADAVTAEIAVGRGPRALAGNSSQGLYVANQDDSTVSVVDTDINTVLGPIAVDSGPAALALDGASSTVYVASGGAGTLSAVDATTDRVTATVAVGRDPAAVVVQPATQAVYVANAGDGTVSVIDTTSMSVVATIPVGAQPTGLAVDTAASAVYTANAGDGTVSVIDTTSLTVLATISVGGQPAGIAVDSGSGAVFVADSGDGTVSVLRAR